MSLKSDFYKYTKQNYSKFVDIFDNKLNNPNRPLEVDKLKSELNKLFKDNKCLDVEYTVNTDKLFFGMCTLPAGECRHILNMEKKCIEGIKSYYIEIDSKLFNPAIGFNGRQLTAMMLHEIGHVVLNPFMIEEFKNQIAVYCAKEKISFTDPPNYMTEYLFEFAFTNSIRKLYSLFYRNPEEVYADTFSHRCGFGEDLEEAYEILLKNRLLLNNGVGNKLLVLDWIMRTYLEFNLNRLGILRKLNTSKSLTGSKLEKKAIDKTINNINNHNNTESLMESSGKRDMFDKLKRSGLRSMENELYELKIQVSSTNDEETCLYVLRILNNRIKILEEYITDHDSDVDIERWTTLYGQYLDLRTELTSKKIFGAKRYGLYVDYTKLSNPEDYM